jgi:hypothetical protein
LSKYNNQVSAQTNNKIPKTSSVSPPELNTKD